MNTQAQHQVEAGVVVAATPQTLFGFLADPSRFALWMGPGASIDLRVGGDVLVPYPGGTTGIGKVLRVEQNRLVEFSWGYQGPQGGDPQPCGVVCITIEPVADGTRVTLRHGGLPDEKAVMGHRAGWTHYVSTLALVANAAHFAPALANIDVLHAAWNEADESKREALLQQCWSEHGQFRSAYAYLSGRRALFDHIANARVHMPGISLRRKGEAASCHSYAKFGWEAVAANGMTVATGTDFVQFSHDGKFALHVGFWDPPNRAG